MKVRVDGPVNLKVLEANIGSILLLTLLRVQPEEVELLGCKMELP